MMGLIILLFLSVVFCQRIPSTFIARAVPYITLYNTRFPTVYYYDESIGQRADIFPSADSGPSCSAITFTSGVPSKTYFLVYKYLDMDFVTPLCFEVPYSFYGIEFRLIRPFGTGSVLNEPTITILGPSNFTWYSVANTSNFYYPRAASSPLISDIYSSFEPEIPDPNVWKLPNCIPLNSQNLGSNAPPPLSPFPPAFSYTSLTIDNYALSISNTSYFDTVNQLKRQDLGLTWFGNFQVIYTQLYANGNVYNSVDKLNIVPTPCVFLKNPTPIYNRNVDYYGTITAKNQAKTLNLNIYKRDGYIFGFDNTTNELKLINEGLVFQETITNWNPSPPNPQLFVPPAECYQYPFANSLPHPNLAAPSFPTAYTISFLDYFNVMETIYYNGDTQMWRSEYFNTTTIQKGNVQYEFNNPRTNNPAIIPQPCNFYTQSFFPPVNIPTTFPTYLGNVQYEGQTAEVWAGGDFISYWASSSPILFLSPDRFYLVHFYQPGPPSVDFNIPSVCLPNK